jgi:hypothetical protein
MDFSAASACCNNKFTTEICGQAGILWFNTGSIYWVSSVTFNGIPAASLHNEIAIRHFSATVPAGNTTGNMVYKRTRVQMCCYWYCLLLQKHFLFVIITGSFCFMYSNTLN